jgi:thymidylate kinase
MNQLVLSTLQRLDQQHIVYCLLRDGHRLETAAADGELDLLVDGAQGAELREVLARLGFVRLPAWGHAPHQFFVAYVESCHRWLKLDVVTEVAYGRPSHALATPLAERCLARRRRLGRAFVLAPEDELLTLLLHCVLDKRSFRPHHASRLQALGRELDPMQGLIPLLETWWSPRMPAEQVLAHIEAGNWDALLAEAGAVSARLARRKPLGTLWRRIESPLLRKLQRWSGIVRPRAPSVALLAPDGAGKSTLIEGLRQSFYLSTYTTHMGLYRKDEPACPVSGEIRENPAPCSVSRKDSDRAASKAAEPSRIPRRRFRLKGFGLLRNLGMQWRQYAVARWHQARGQLVLFDRYTYDALLPARASLGPLRRLRRRLLAHACPAPDMVVVLDAPGQVLFARKGEHTAELLEQQRQSYLAMRSRLPQMVVVDATGDPNQVCRAVTSAIWRDVARRLEGRPA